MYYRYELTSTKVLEYEEFCRSRRRVLSTEAEGEGHDKEAYVRQIHG